MRVITARRIYRRNTPQFLKITAVDFDGEVADAPLFEGWMFASSPALSGLEHAVYDLTMLSCNS